jgi:hypothetical protein
MLIIFTQPSWAEDKTCTTSGCTYSVSLDRTGFYIAVVTLPNGQPEGVWSLVMNPGRAQPYYGGGFFAGGTLKERSQFGSWIGFSLAQGERVKIKPTNYTGNQAPLQMRIEKEIPNSDRVLVDDWTSRTPGQTFTTRTLDPGFYVISVKLSQPHALVHTNNTFFGLDLGAPSIYGGVVGGWLDSQPGSAGYGAFYLDSPRTMDFQLMFDGDYGTGGAGQPQLEIYYQKEDGTREVYWSAPKQDSVGEVIKPTIPIVLPEPAVLPPDPGEAGKTSLEGIDSDKDGVRDDVQRYIAATYPAPEDKPLRAALREYSAFLQQFVVFASDKGNVMANAQMSGEIVDCIFYFHPKDGGDILLDVESTSIDTDQRNLAYIKANAQLNDEMFSLTPSSELPQVCSRFTEQGGQRSSIRADEQLSEPKACSNEKFTYIVFGNGINNSMVAARGSLDVLKAAFEEGKTPEEKNKFKYDLAYNQDEKFLLDVFQVFKMKRGEKNLNFRDFVEGNVKDASSPEVQQAVIDAAAQITEEYFKKDPDMRAHVTAYEEWIDSGNRVVVVAHSQGTQYVVFDYSKLKLDDQGREHPRLKSFGTVEVAKVSTPIIGPYTTLDIDKVVSAFRLKAPSIPMANMENTSYSGKGPEFMGHNFIRSYMDGNNSRAQILGDVNTAIGSLEFPEKKPLASIQKATPSSGAAPLTVNLEAKLPDSGANPNYAYSWSASDGQKAEGVTTSMTFNTAGTYTITLMVKDGSKEECSQTSLERTVTVTTSEEVATQEVSIQLAVIGSSTIQPGESLTLQISWNAPQGNAKEIIVNHGMDMSGFARIILNETEYTGGTQTHTLRNNGTDMASCGSERDIYAELYPGGWGGTFAIAKSNAIKATPLCSK